MTGLEILRNLILLSHKDMRTMSARYLAIEEEHSFAELLLDEMRDWEIDYSRHHPRENETQVIKK